VSEEDARTRSPKGERTRARILETALGLLRERGYEGTTMRAIAERAGVAIGNAYHYFPSKEALLQAFYARTHEEHLAACAPLLARTADFRRRLEVVMEAKIATIEPYHGVAGALLATASNPESPLNPFSPESADVRKQATALFAEVVDGSTTKIHREVRSRLPTLLWVWHMGVVLFWVHDRSRGRERTRRLLDRSIDLIVRLVGLAGNPLLAPLRNRAFRLLDEVLAPS
jgi:AcrR family transcriptional regulator